MSRSLMIASALLAYSGCVFELAPIASTGSGGAGGGAPGGGGSTSGFEVLISYDGRNVPSTQSDVPVLVRLDPSRIDYDLAAGDGSDLRFFDEDGSTPLAHELERWTPGGDSIVWVRLPVVDTSGGSFRMRFGDSSASAPPSPTQVWTRYEGVYHFADPSGATAQDSVAGADGTGMGTTSAQGRIGDAFGFDGSARVDVGPVASFDVPLSGARSVSLWFQRTTTMATSMTIARTKNAGCDGWNFLILGDQFANLRMDIGIGSPCNVTQNFNTDPFAIPMGQDDVEWHRATVVMDRASGMTTFYLDASPMNTATLGTTGTMAGEDVVFGVGPFAGDTNFFIGNLDELRIGSGAFDANWVSLTYLIDEDQLLEYGTVQPLAP